MQITESDPNTVLLINQYICFFSSLAMKITIALKSEMTTYKFKQKT